MDPSTPLGMTLNHFPIGRIGGSLGGSFTGMAGALMGLCVDDPPPITVLAMDEPRVASGFRPRLRVKKSLADEVSAVRLTAKSRDELAPALNDPSLASDFCARISLCESCGVVDFFEKMLLRKDITNYLYAFRNSVPR